MDPKKQKMAGAKKGAGHKSRMSVVQIPADRKNTELSYVVHAVKIRGIKIPETLDTVGVPPTVSKAFRCFGDPSAARTPDTLLKREVLCLLS